MAEKYTYSFQIGLWKSLKNTLIVIGVPAVLFLLDNWVNWFPDEYKTIGLPIFGFLSYLVKNYIENK
jgi:hypothetical protein